MSTYIDGVEARGPNLESTMWNETGRYNVSRLEAYQRRRGVHRG